MYRLLLTLLFLTTSSYAYTDTDFDGVEDGYDLCPQTPLSDLVDRDGCVIKSVGSKISFDLIAGFGYSQMNYASQEPSDTLSTSLQTDIYMQEIGGFKGSYPTIDPITVSSLKAV